MEKIPVQKIKDLRNMTQASVNDCKDVLEKAGGDTAKAVSLLRERGLEIARAKKDRIAQEGRIESYLHPGSKLGVLIEVNCETDFVARSEDFCKFTRDLSMQIAAVSPICIGRDDLSKEMIDKIENKEEFYKNNCLLEQSFIKDSSITIKELLADLIGKMSENIVIRRFIRYKIGEGLQ